MSFLKFWGKKGKKEEADLKKEEMVDPEAEKRRLKHSLSISRSGRFKQRKRERGQILDKPELFNGQSQEGFDENASHARPVNHASHATRPGLQASSAHQRSPNTPCRDVNKNMTSGQLRMGQSVVT